MFVDMEKIYLITDVDGFTPQIGKLVSMMNYARLTTLQTINGLNRQQLDYLYDAESNSIGALLMHMASVEFIYQLHTMFDRSMTVEEQEKWGPALDLGEEGRNRIGGYELDYYVNELAEIRKTTLEQLRLRDDEWLYRETSFWGGKPANNFFKWFHVFEDEINHRGQMRWLRKRILQAGL